MPIKFLESVGSKVAEQWIATLLTPAFIFWAGGAGAVIKHFSWATVFAWLTQQTEPVQIALLIAAFCTVTVSAFIVQRFELTVLRFLEGYWPPRLWPLRHLRLRLTMQEVKRSQRISDRWQALSLVPVAQRNTNQRDELAYLDWQQHSFPLPEEIMPTRLGNILCAAERRPLQKYGLDATVCWSRLWLLLPDAVKQELKTARSKLNDAARAWLWSMLFMIWGIWIWWLIPAAIISVLFAYYQWAISAAINYGDLIEATFDLYRHLLYDAIRWQLPVDPNKEREVGRKLTECLWRGF